ncbi:D-alanine--D-alanine ligase family protein [Paenibacillus sp. LHD-117]|uniref:D-alanine--D-alanine ligase family protein n=1 Tax=Paenibacillus sp. LHD-117 TaxID=3071412 RepID=UPI0027E19795|nr:D-alanine--D-alanine ligase family protein [Paenibacillus sp. LHD-117]MDQ6420981.1 D-alanine--D-alanine ligase family protein [Paenibacillus sp. LHD-117]
MKINLFVLYGGKSVEHEVSLKTALTVLGSVDQSKFDVYPVYITREGQWRCAGLQEQPPAGMENLVPKREDAAPGQASESIGNVLLRYFSVEGKKAALPLLHGSNGEDGTVQGLLELLDIPYVGNGVLGAALTLDKDVSKRLLEQAGIRQTRYISFGLGEWLEQGPALMERVQRELGLPCYVKPATLGSSIGISRCENVRQLSEGIEEAFRYDRRLVVEREIPGREIQVAVMGNDRPIASMPGEFIHRHRFFDFESKYMDKELVMSIPAELPEGVTARIRGTALRAYRALCCSGLARVDFFLDAEGELYLNEINALPGFTGTSMYPVMWERTDGTTYSELIEKLIDYAFMRHAEKETIRYTR